MRELSASDITRDALLILQAKGWEVWRQNNIAVRGRKFIGKKGQGDIIGFHRTNGRFIAVEVKKIGDTIKDDQHKFLSTVQRAGAVAMLAMQEGQSVVLKDYQQIN
jgi:hypothetical protein